ncbi:MAG: FMN-binding protein [Oscillospiraceae bacterium]
MSEKTVKSSGSDMQESPKNSFFNSDMLKPIIVLSVICIVVSALLALTNSITSPIIEAKALEAAVATRRLVLPDATSFTELETTVEDVVSVHKDDGGSGYVIIAIGHGYKGDVPVTVGLDKDGKIVGISADASHETANVGSKVGQPEYLNQYMGLAPGQTDSISGATQASEDNAGGASAQANVDILSGATISSKAINSAVNLVYEAFNEVKEG